MWIISLRLALYFWIFLTSIVCEINEIGVFFVWDILVSFILVYSFMFEKLPFRLLAFVLLFILVYILDFLVPYYYRIRQNLIITFTTGKVELRLFIDVLSLFTLISLSSIMQEDGEESNKRRENSQYEQKKQFISKSSTLSWVFINDIEN